MFLGGGGPGLSSRPFAEETQAKIDAEVSAMLTRAEKHAIDLLSQNQDKLRRLADLLMTNETINGSDVYAIAGVPEPSGIEVGFTLAPDRAAAAAGAKAAASGTKPANIAAASPSRDDS